MTDDEARRILAKHDKRTVVQPRALPSKADMDTIAMRQAVDAQQELQRHWQSVNDWATRREVEFRRARMIADGAALRRLEG